MSNYVLIRALSTESKSKPFVIVSYEDLDASCILGCYHAAFVHATLHSITCWRRSIAIIDAGDSVCSSFCEFCSIYAKSRPKFSVLLATRAISFTEGTVCVTNFRSKFVWQDKERKCFWHHEHYQGQLHWYLAVKRRAELQLERNVLCLCYQRCCFVAGNGQSSRWKRSEPKLDWFTQLNATLLRCERRSCWCYWLATWKRAQLEPSRHVWLDSNILLHSWGQHCNCSETCIDWLWCRLRW